MDGYFWPSTYGVCVCVCLLSFRNSSDFSWVCDAVHVWLLVECASLTTDMLCVIRQVSLFQDRNLDLNVLRVRKSVLKRNFCVYSHDDLSVKSGLSHGRSMFSPSLICRWSVHICKEPGVSARYWEAVPVTHLPISRSCLLFFLLTVQSLANSTVVFTNHFVSVMGHVSCLWTAAYGDV